MLYNQLLVLFGFHAVLIHNITLPIRILIPFIMWRVKKYGVNFWEIARWGDLGQVSLGKYECPKSPNVIMFFFSGQAMPKTYKNNQ